MVIKSLILLPIVVARNPLGQATATVRVVLGDISTSPESPVVEAMTDTDILISWKTPSALNHTPVTCYKVQMGYIGKYIFQSLALLYLNFYLTSYISIERY